MKPTQQSKNCRSVAPKNFPFTSTKRFAEGIFSTTLWRCVWNRIQTPDLKLRCNQDVISTTSAYKISKPSLGTILVADWLCTKTGNVCDKSEILTCLVIPHAL